MPDHTSIYRQEAERYHLLISKQPNLALYIEEIRPFAGLDIVDLGAGTGRLATVLAPQAKSLVALDASQPMLDVTAARLKQAGLANWSTQQADHRHIPLPEQSADLLVAGWTICYLASSNDPRWKQNLADVIAEMKRIIRPGGTIIIFETMGTGTETPNPPDFLRDYYRELAETYGFAHTWIRTDYEFDSVEQAVELTRFFFGEQLADRVLAQQSKRVAECAGIWWLHV